MKQLLITILAISLFAACQDKGRVVEPKGNVAHLVMAEQEYDFGYVSDQKAIVTHDFYFVNDGKEKLVITNVHPLCHCTTVDYPKEPIKPGHRGKITVALNVTDLTHGYFSRSIDISTNRNEERISVKGEKY